jgi:hypothetical protein
VLVAAAGVVLEVVTVQSPQIPVVVFAWTARGVGYPIMCC